MGKMFGAGRARFELQSNINSVACTENAVFCVDSSGFVCEIKILQQSLHLVRLKIIESCVMISCGSEHTLALTSNGVCFGWGKNSFGCLSTSESTLKLLTPTYLTNCADFISCGSYHSCVLSSGTLFSCGRGTSGQLGLGLTSRSSLTRVPTPERSIEVSCGLNHTGLISTSNHLYTSGDNTYGQLGLGHTSSQSSFTRVSIDSVQKISFGHHSACISNGKLYLWGTGVFGSYLYPKLIDCDRVICKVEVSHCAGAAIDESGGLWGWGSNSFEELGPGGELVRPLRILRFFSAVEVAMTNRSCVVIGRSNEKVERVERGGGIEEEEYCGEEAEIRESLDRVKEIEMRVEDLEKSEVRAAREIERLRTENLEVVLENKRVREENFELRAMKRVLEREIERLNDVIDGMESEICFGMNEKKEMVERLRKKMQGEYRWDQQDYRENVQGILTKGECAEKDKNRGEKFAK